MFRSMNLFLSAIFTSFLSFLFLLNEKSNKAIEIRIPNGSHQLLNVDGNNFELLQSNYWYVFLTHDIIKSKEKIEKLLEVTNVAILEIDSFNKAYLVSRFKTRKFPKEFFLYDGVINGKTPLNDKLSNYDFWFAVDIYISVIFSVYYEFICQYFNTILTESSLNVYRLCDGGRFSMNFVVLF
ncbi:hypothetical protein H312_01906 [Anncaliia algerae PRA339]|uniref:Uncharacterized protein n=1 Tax=Anncaliia algerae PRA339 TaxID=1288291 RepID=A0A059F080_9MICR|nr:hypothetical protein H312_01906 [Anncaliia algerae PRA339]